MKKVHWTEVANALRDNFYIVTPEGILTKFRFENNHIIFTFENGVDLTLNSQILHALHINSDLYRNVPGSKLPEYQTLQNTTLPEDNL